MQTQNTTTEMIITAEEEAFNLPDEPTPNTETTTTLTPWELAVEEQIELEDALSHIVVSDAVRRECERELAAAAKRDYRII